MGQLHIRLEQFIVDGAKVPLYYENRIPELQLTDEQLNEEIERLLEDAELDDELMLLPSV